MRLKSLEMTLIKEPLNHLTHNLLNFHEVFNTSSSSVHIAHMSPRPRLCPRIKYLKRRVYVCSGKGNFSFTVSDYCMAAYTFSPYKPPLKAHFSIHFAVADTSLLYIIQTVSCLKTDLRHTLPIGRPTRADYISPIEDTLSTHFFLPTGSHYLRLYNLAEDRPTLCLYVLRLPYLGHSSKLGSTINSSP